MYLLCPGEEMLPTSSHEDTLLFLFKTLLFVPFTFRTAVHHEYQVREESRQTIFHIYIYVKYMEYGHTD